MSREKINLCSFVLSEYYGPICEKVGVYLLKNGPCPIKLIANNCDLKLNQAKKVIYTLLHHDILTYEMHPKGYLEYTILSDEITRKLRYPHYIVAMKERFGDIAELIFSEILENSQIELHKLVQKVINKTKPTEKATEDEVLDAFITLSNDGYVRCRPLVTTDDNDQPVPSFSSNRILQIPADLILEIRRSNKRPLDSDDSNPNKRVKLDNGKKHETSSADTQTHKDILLWSADYTKIEEHMRNQIIFNATRLHLDKIAASIVLMVLNLNTTKDNDGLSTCVSYYQIVKKMQFMPHYKQLSNETITNYLKLLTTDKMEVLTKVDDIAGGMYAVPLNKCIYNINMAHIESMILEKYGSKCFRIFKLLTIKKQLEHKQIEDLALIPAKEAKDILYRLLADHVIITTEIPKTGDYNPSRTFYLFSVSIPALTRQLLLKCYKTLYNIMARRKSENDLSRRLLEKESKVSAILDSLQDSAAGLTEEQEQDIKESITLSERDQLDSVKITVNKLDLAESQVDFSLHMFELALHLKLNTDD